MFYNICSRTIIFFFATSVLAVLSEKTSSERQKIQDEFQKYKERMKMHKPLKKRIVFEEELAEGSGEVSEEEIENPFALNMRIIMVVPNKKLCPKGQKLFREKCRKIKVV